MWLEAQLNLRVNVAADPVQGPLTELKYLRRLLVQQFPKVPNDLIFLIDDVATLVDQITVGVHWSLKIVARSAVDDLRLKFFGLEVFRHLADDVVDTVFGCLVVEQFR